MTMTVVSLLGMLEAFSWTRSFANDGVFEVWSSRTGGREIIVPLDNGRTDYSFLLERACRDVVTYVGDPASRYLELAELSESAGLELSKWRKETRLGAGLISWPQGEALYGSVKGALAAAAKSAREPRKYHGHASAHVAKRFLEEAFMGQTQVGSFVVTAHIPTSKNIHLSKSSEEHARSEPKKVETISAGLILDKLESALLAAKAGVEEYSKSPNLEIFNESIQSGVSHELAKALGEFTKDGESSIVLERQADLVRPGRRTEVEFSAPDSVVFRQLARKLAVEMEPRQVALVGEVTLLSKSSDDPIQLIRLNVEPGGAVRKARVRLNDEQYVVALDAHANDRPLHVVGQLEREGNNYWLYHVSAVEVLEPEPEGPIDQLLW